MRLSYDTRAVPFKMRETVLGDTPALRATSSNVDGGVELSSSIKSDPIFLKLGAAASNRIGSNYENLFSNSLS